MILEDLHWIDSASEELVRKIVNSEVKLRLLLLISRRPDYMPPWLDQPVVTELSLQPLPVGDIRHLVQARLNVEILPEVLARWVSEKAEAILFRRRDCGLPNRAWHSPHNRNARV
jgi:predicted ATPase